MPASLPAVNPPASGVKVENYICLLTLQAGTKANTSPTTVESRSYKVQATKLTPGARYLVTAQALIGGQVTTVANMLPLIMAAPGAPTLVTAADTSSTTGAATAVAPPSVQFQKYIFTARPLNGGQPKVVEAAGPQAAFVQLTPATQYEVTVVGVANGAKSPTSNSVRFVTPAAGTPANAAKSLTSNVAEVVITPPLIGGPWTSFEVTVCPIGGPQVLCIKTTCTSPTKCKLSGLRAMTTYVVSSVALKTVNGQIVRSPRSNEDTFTTPAVPLLVSAQAWGATTGQATATGALGEQYR